MRCGYVPSTRQPEPSYPPTNLHPPAAPRPPTVSLFLTPIIPARSPESESSAQSHAEIYHSALGPPGPCAPGPASRALQQGLQPVRLAIITKCRAFVGSPPALLCCCWHWQYAGGRTRFSFSSFAFLVLLSYSLIHAELHRPVSISKSLGFTSLSSELLVADCLLTYMRVGGTASRQAQQLFEPS